MGMRKHRLVDIPRDNDWKEESWNKRLKIIGVWFWTIFSLDQCPIFYIAIYFPANYVLHTQCHIIKNKYNSTN